MKKTYLLSSFVAISAGAISAGALHINGSDTLFNITNDVISGKQFSPALSPTPNPITTLVYDGGGSGTGEANMAAGTQQISPMSRFVKSGAPCTGAQASPSTTEGLVIGLDGVSLVMNANTGASAACNGASQTDTSKNSALGLAANTTFTWNSGTYLTYGKTTATYKGCDNGSAQCPYTFTDWTDVIRILFAGMDHSAGSAAANQNCKSDVRAALIAQWGALFETANCNGSCTSLHHGFRRDDFSGTTDTVVSVLNLPSIPSSHATDPFCNAPNFSAAANGTWPPVGLPAYEAYGTAAQTLTQSGTAAGLRPLATFQDLDPIRTACGDTTDAVCEADGTLGWELVIEPTSDVTQAQAYHANAATTTFGYATAPQLYYTPALTYYCPNGDQPVFVSECLFPVDAAGDFGNLAAKATVPLFTFCNSPTCTTYQPSTKIDGRVYNLFLHQGNANPTKNFAFYTAANGLPFQASHFRNYQASCQQNDATQQIGCVIGGPENCSIGYAGLAATGQAGADYMRIDGILPVTQNVQAFSYPISRKLYLSTLKGFANVGDTNGELTFAKAEADANEMEYYISNEGFIVLPVSQNGINLPAGSTTVAWGAGTVGKPYCEDFNEKNICGSATNNPACGTNASVGLPTGSTTCGDGNLGVFERCDSGTSNGTSASNCSLTCTCLKGGVDANGLCCVNAAGTDCCAHPDVCTAGQNI